LRTGFVDDHFQHTRGLSPATPLAEVFVILEAVVGMFYLAVILASLVGTLRPKGSEESAASG
jgi:hypothetical protein